MDLTTVHQDAAALARHAVRLAVGMLSGEAGGDDVVLEPELVVRGTTAPPRQWSTSPQRQRSTSVVSK